MFPFFVSPNKHRRAPPRRFQHCSMLCSVVACVRVHVSIVSKYMIISLSISSSYHAYQYHIEKSLSYHHHQYHHHIMIINIISKKYMIKYMITSLSILSSYHAYQYHIEKSSSYHDHQYHHHIMIINIIIIS